MQSRLTRSRHEKMIAGVCGGISTYFSIDPVIVRLFFVLLTLTTGFGPPAYIILWVVMPRSRALPDAAAPPAPEAARLGQQEAQPFEQASWQRSRHEVLVAQQEPHYQQRMGAADAPAWQAPPQASEQPMPQPDEQTPATGSTIRLPADADAASHLCQHHRRHNWRTLGVILLGIGGLVLLEQLTGSSLAFLFPVLLIAAGIYLLRR
jgi:phage shock protein C